MYGLRPHCTVCLRRIRSSITSVNESTSIPDLLWHSSNQLRCRTCAIYAAGTTQSSSNVSSALTPMNISRRCVHCGLEGNIWVCLICGHNGCGRYSSQHAKLHFEESRHSFALELATGRYYHTVVEIFHSTHILYLVF